ncbi:homeodomain-containing protein [Streptomyces sp. TLI_185]|nr:homeodomain-containing protein [Streptomyces sp. TLI_185]
MGVSRACARKWVNRWRLHGDAGLQDRPSSPHRSPNATPASAIEQIESWRREHKWSAQRITDELVSIGFCDRPTDCQSTPDPARPRQTPLHRPRRREQPEAGKDHRPMVRTHGAPGCEEGRPGRSAATSTCTPSSMDSHGSPTQNRWAMRRAQRLLPSRPSERSGSPPTASTTTSNPHTSSSALPGVPAPATGHRQAPCRPAPSGRSLLVRRPPSPPAQPHSEHRLQRRRPYPIRFPGGRIKPNVSQLAQVPLEDSEDHT